MSINAKLLASGLILGVLGAGFSLAIDRSGDAALMSAAQIFEKGVDPLTRLQAASIKSSQLADRFLAGDAEQDPNGVLERNEGARLLSGLSGVLTDLRAASVSLDPGKTSQRLGELAYGLNRLRLTDGDVTRRLVRRELSSLVDDFDRAVNGLREDVLAMRARSAQHTVDIQTLVLAGGLAGLLAGAILMVYLSRSIGRSIRQATSTLLRAGGSDVEASDAPQRDAIRELDRAIRFVEAAMARTTHEAKHQSQETVRRFEGELQRQQKRFDAALNTMPQAYCLLDEEGVLAAANEPFLRLFPDLRIGAGAQDIRKNDIFAELMGSADDEVFSRETANGRHFEIRRHRNPGVGGTIVIVDDITEQTVARSEVERLSGQDALTGLPNRARFYNRLEAALRDEAVAKDMAILAIDVDGLNNVNATLGHSAGDELLRQLGDRLRTLVGPDDLVARLDGDEFGILHLTAGQPAAGERLSRAIIENLERTPVNVAGRPLALGVAIGMVSPKSLAATATIDAQAVMQDCEIALHQAKLDQSGRFKLYQPELREELQAKRRLAIDLREALKRNEFELYFQPIVSLKRQAVSGFEALVRWNHPTRGQVSPGEFIPLMEELGLIVQLGRFVLFEGCRHAARWPESLSLSVNLSPLQFKSKGLVADVRQALETTGLAPARLQLEVTESLFLDDADAVLATLSELRSLGLIVSMDDFGTGYSSLGYLSRFPFDKIKIDQSFVRDMYRAENIAIVRAVMGLGAAMKMMVIAEGVETAEQMSRLEQEGCVEMQGFLFARPRPASDLPKMLVEVREGFARGLYCSAPANDAARRAG